jgi:hypothetical protein
MASGDSTVAGRLAAALAGAAGAASARLRSARPLSCWRVVVAAAAGLEPTTKPLSAVRAARAARPDRPARREIQATTAGCWAAGVEASRAGRAEPAAWPVRSAAEQALARAERSQARPARRRLARPAERAQPPRLRPPSPRVAAAEAAGRSAVAAGAAAPAIPAPPVVAALAPAGARATLRREPSRPLRPVSRPATARSRSPTRTPHRGAGELHGRGGPDPHGPRAGAALGRFRSERRSAHRPSGERALTRDGGDAPAELGAASDSGDGQGGRHAGVLAGDVGERSHRLCLSVEP